MIQTKKIEGYGFALVEHLVAAAEEDPRHKGLALTALRAIDAVTSPKTTTLDEETRRAPHDILHATNRPWGKDALRGMSPEGSAELEEIDALVKKKYQASRNNN